MFQDPTQFFSMPLINAVARELSQSYVRSSSAAARTPAAAANTVIQWQPRMAKFPHPSLQTTSLLGQVLSSFIFASLMFGFVTQVGRDERYWQGNIIILLAAKFFGIDELLTMGWVGCSCTVMWAGGRKTSACALG